MVCLSASYYFSWDIINLAKKKSNIVPMIKEAQHPHKFHMFIAMGNAILVNVAQPDQTQIVAPNTPPSFGIEDTL
jgi:rRNA 2'-O-methyltransferase fibrillarin